MHRITRALLAIALSVAVITASAAVAPAQEQDLEANWAVSLNPEAAGHMEMGDESFGNGNYAGARAHYQQAVDIIRGDGDFPNTALHRIAATYYFEGKPQTAAAQMDALAEEAATFGDLVTEVWALADGAWIHGKQGAKIDMENRVAKLRKLLRSPYLPFEVRSEIMSNRLGEATTIMLIVPMERP